MIENFKNNITFKSNNLIERDFAYKNNEIKINNKEKKPKIERDKINQSKENNYNNIFNFVDDFNNIQINDKGKN